ncbi:glycosyltransferase family 4 protein [Paenibacillus ihuae]|uniref:glycosyltransferase family 4 protein n=1 Tax=Paenibacillus ihuae TaxID=1232431 RepID=UPI0006D530F3|nr:glycosyltransferase family 4 protein [Paenibacillus ihuae]
MKILYFQNIPVPYRVDFFNELGKYVDLTVVFLAEVSSELNSNWFSKKANNFSSIFLKKGKINDKAINLKILKYINKNEYDLIVISNYYIPTVMLAIEKLRLLGIPFVYSSDGAFVKLEENQLIKMLKTHFISSAEYWLSTGRITDEQYLSYGARKERIFKYPFTSLKKEDILSKPIPLDEKIKCKKELNINEDKVILTVGQFIYRKGIDVLLNSCMELPSSCGIYIVGGEPTEEFIKLRDNLKLKNVKFVDFKNKEDLSKYYKSADLFVLPTREDIWGLVINEAMAHGLPVITTDKCIAGLELVKNGENGYIVPSENCKTLAEKINSILFNDRLLKEMSENSLLKIQSFNIENMAQVHLEIFSQLISRKMQLSDTV